MQWRWNTIVFSFAWEIRVQFVVATDGRVSDKDSRVFVKTQAYSHDLPVLSSGRGLKEIDIFPWTAPTSIGIDGKSLPCVRCACELNVFAGSICSKIWSLRVNDDYTPDLDRIGGSAE